MIRKAEYKDITILNRLGLQLNENFCSTYNLDSYLSNDNYFILVYEDISIYGFLIVYKNIDYYELEFIVVDYLHRKKGIASMLINHFIDNYTNLNDVILLEVATRNASAVALYNKFNFEVINIRKAYYKNDDAYVMKKVIK